MPSNIFDQLKDPKTLEELNPILQAAQTALSIAAPLGFASAPISAGLSFGLNLAQGSAMRRSAQKQRNQLRKAAERTENIGIGQQQRAEQEAISRYRTQRAVGDEQASQMYGQSMQTAFAQRDYAGLRAQELRSQAAQIAVPETKDIIRGAAMRGIQAGVTDLVATKAKKDLAGLFKKAPVDAVDTTSPSRLQTMEQVIQEKKYDPLGISRTSGDQDLFKSRTTPNFSFKKNLYDLDSFEQRRRLRWGD